MTPKEKAAQLVSAFRKFTDGTDYETHRYKLNIEKENAKQCTYIAVDQLMGAIDAEDHVILYNYWQQVKKEIENL